MRRKLLLPVITLLISTNLYGCSNSKEIDDIKAYKEQLVSYSSEISTIRNEISNLDAQSEDSTNEVLTLLDDLNIIFTEISLLEVPKQYSSVEQFAVDAAVNMEAANDAYHTLFSTQPFDEYNALVAEQSYNNAFKRLYNVGEILQGMEPSGDDVTIVPNNIFSED